MNRPDIYDISHHNTVTDWSLVDDVPIVHKVNEGRFTDPRWRDRAPIIAGRHERFGGYTVLIVSASSIREQCERFVELIAPWWRPGACAQLDVEPWEAYDRPPNAGEIVEAHELLEQWLGRPPAFYFNPRTMPGVLEQVRAQLPDVALWEAHYGRRGHAVAVEHGAVLHQWTSQHPAAGFRSGIDANTILKPAVWDRLCGLDTTTPKEPDMRLIHLANDPAVLLEHGATVTWVQTPPMLDELVRTYGLDPTPATVTPEHLRNRVLVGPNPVGDGVRVRPGMFGATT